MRHALIGFISVLTGMFVLVASMGLTGSWVLSVAVAAVSSVLCVAGCSRARWLHFDAVVCPSPLRMISLLAMAVALVQLSRLVVFMIQPAQTGFSFVPASRWEVGHSCATAYFVAARAAGAGVNVYTDSLYTARDDDPTKLRKAKKLGSFNIDVYEYPPPFLLLPRALLPLAPEFLDFRMLWFGLSGISFLVGVFVVASLLGPIAGTRALLLSPLVWVALPTFSLLQKGNVQGTVIAMSMLAMTLFQRRRPVAGGALLAFATLSKLFPGMLVVYLIARREWKALAWTSVFSVVFVALSLVAFGGEMYGSFFEHLPRLLSGEAFPAFRNPSALAMNFSIPSFLFKLKPFGVTGIDFTVSRVVGWVYTMVVVLLTVVVARRARRDGSEPLVWLGILIFATLRSPFIPQAYAAIPPLWLLTLMAASREPTRAALAGVLLAWVALNVYVPHDLGVDPRIMAILNLAPMATTIVFAAKALRAGSGSTTTVSPGRDGGRDAVSYAV